MHHNANFTSPRSAPFFGASVFIPEDLFRLFRLSTFLFEIVHLTSQWAFWTVQFYSFRLSSCFFSDRLLSDFRIVFFRRPSTFSLLDRTRLRYIASKQNKPFCVILRDCIFSATGSYIFRLSVSQSWLTNYSQVPYIFSERTIYFFLTDDSFMILRDRIFYAKRSYIFSEKTVFFQYSRAVYFRRPFILHRGHYIFSSKIVYFTVDPLISLKYSLSQIFSLIEPKKWLRIFENFFDFWPIFDFLAKIFFF